MCFQTLVSGAETRERAFDVINAANGLADNSAQIVACTKTGRMIISTIGNLNFYDGGSFSHIDTHQEFQYPLPSYSGHYHLYFDRRHHIWLKNKYTVTCVDLLQEQFVKDIDRIIREELGCAETVKDLYVDSEGHIWLLTGQGLYGVEQKMTYRVLPDRNLQDVEVYGNMLLTFYDDGQEVAFDLTTGRTAHRTRPYDAETAQAYIKSGVLLLNNDHIYQIRNGEKGSILLCFDLKKVQWSKMMELPYHLNNMALHEGLLYLPSEYGYWTYNLTTGEQVHIESLVMSDGRLLSTDCNTLTFDKQGGLWIGTERRGLLYAHPNVSPFKVLTWDNPEAGRYAMMMDSIQQNITEFRGQRANCRYVDSRGWTWYGTTTGLYLFRKADGEAEVFNKFNGLLNNVVHSVIEDQQHNIWLSTSCGISCIQFEGDRVDFVNSYNERDNVPSEAFINCKAIRLADGRIVMQALDHVIVFQPASFLTLKHRKAYQLSPKLVKIMVNGHKVLPNAELDGHVIIDRAVSRATDINLSAEQNSISMLFSGLNYFRPLQTFYRVRIVGLDDRWRLFSYFSENSSVDSDGMLNLPLINLSPGEYRVEVQVSMYPDVWDDDETPYAWTIHVNQPWWRTTGVYIVLLLLLSILLGVNFWLYSRNTKLRLRRSEAEGDVVRKVRSFIERFNMLSVEPLSPLEDELFGEKENEHKQLSPEFTELMLKLIPYLHSHRQAELTMNLIVKVAGMEIMKLYDMLTKNLYKNPRELVRVYRLRQAEDMLLHSDKSIGQIAADCGFYTPNYFIGNFFHHYKQTPLEYRRTQANG